jgi:hypothetical protein
MTEPKTDTKSVEAKDAKTAERRSEAKTADTKVDTYRVTAPYVTLKSRSDTGAQVVLGYFQGALVPETVDLENLASHIRKGMVEKIEGPELKTVRQQQADADKAAETAAVPQDKEGAEAVADAEAQVKAAEEAEVKADAEAKKTRTPRVKAADSPRGAATAMTG